MSAAQCHEVAPPVLVAAGSTAPANLAEAVISARLAGRSERDVAKAFDVSRYRVKKLTADALSAASAAANGHPVHQAT